MNTITIPAGKTAEVGLALRPVGDVGAPGSDAPFQVTVTPVASPGDAIATTVPFTVPEIRGVDLSATPSPAQAFVATPATVQLTIHSSANVPQNISFTADVSSGLSLSGLTDTVVDPGQTIIQTLTLTPSPNQPIDSELGVVIHATFGGQLPVVLAIPVRITVPGADAIAMAAEAANQLGHTDLFARLNDLSFALTNLVQDPTDDVAKSQSLASLGSILSLLAVDPILATFVDPLTARRDELLAATTVVEIQAAVTNLGSVLDNFGEAVSNVAHHNFQLFVTPNARSRHSRWCQSSS